MVNEFRIGKYRLILWLAPLSLIGVALWRSLPFLGMSPMGRLLVASQPGRIQSLVFWGAVVIVNLLSAWILWRRYGPGCPRAIYWPYLLALAVGYGLLTGWVVREIGPGKPGGWDVFYLAPDSASYIPPYSAHTSRPPAYSMFIDIFAGSAFDHGFDDSLVNQPLSFPGHPLLQVVRIQKVFLLLASLAACYALMRFLGSPLPAAMFLLLNDFNFFGTEVDYILSDSLAMGLFFLILAIFIEIIRKAEPKPLKLADESSKKSELNFRFNSITLLFPVMGLLCSILYLTRPAGVYGVVLLGAGALWLLITDLRRYFRDVIIGLALSAVLVTIPPLYVYSQTGNFSPAPLYAISRTAFALQVAVPEDVALMTNSQSHQFLEKALERKAISDQQIRIQYQNDPVWVHWHSILSNFNNAILTLQKDFEPPITWNERTAILLDVSGVLLRHHRWDYLKLSWYSFQLETGIMNRLDPFLRHFGISTFWYAIALCLCLSLWLRGKVGFIVFFLFLTHFVNLIIVALFDLPLQRYSGATEYLLLVGILLLMVETGKRMDKKFFRKGSIAQPKVNSG